MGTNFKDYVKELEADLSPEGRQLLDAFRERYSLANELLQLRIERGLTQTQLADLTGIAQSEISRIERGSANPTRETLETLAHGLGARLGLVRDPELAAH